MKKTSWTDRVKNEAVLQRVQEETNILRTIKRRNANWIGCILPDNCLLKHVIERNVEGTGSQGRRRRKLLDNLKERILETESGSARCNSVEHTVLKMLWNCLKTDHEMLFPTPCIVISVA
jgi:hypothetical protein